MPRVPYSNNVVPITQDEGPGPTEFAMAAFMMHQEGRLFDPTLMGPEQKLKRPSMSFISKPIWPQDK